MDLQLSDEQRWLTDSVETLLARESEPDRVWARLVEFGALSVGGEEGLGAVELSLIARSLGAHLASVPFVASAAVRLAAEPLAADLGDGAVALGVLEPGSSWAAPPYGTVLEPVAGGHVVSGRKLAVEHAGTVPYLAVVAAGTERQALAIVDGAGPGVALVPQRAFDATAPVHAVELTDAPLLSEPLAGDVVARIAVAGALLAAAEAVGAAGRMLDDACGYAAERRQFGRPIGSFQALRHLLADLYVRQASSWSSVLYAAAALDEQAGDAARTVSIAKAYVGRAAREVAHGAMQVFGGIAMTAEHPAHRFLRRIVVRDRQFGDAAHHERALGRSLAAAAVPEPVA
jgi:alkylation response protein AidB-like acyl-CoA dehydrogenase